MANEWYVAVEGQVYGPVVWETLRQNALEGRITPQTQIRQGVSGAWRAAGEWEGLFGGESAAVWRVMTADQRVFGPISGEALDSWVREGRIDRYCQVLMDGWEQWRWAADIYLELSSPHPTEPPRAIPVPPPVQASEQSPGFPGIVTGSVTDKYVSSHSAPQPAIREGHGYGDSTRKKKQPPVSAKVVCGLIVFGLPLLCCSGVILNVKNTKPSPEIDRHVKQRAEEAEERWREERYGPFREAAKEGWPDVDQDRVDDIAEALIQMQEKREKERGTGSR